MNTSYLHYSLQRTRIIKSEMDFDVLPEFDLNKAKRRKKTLQGTELTTYDEEFERSKKHRKGKHYDLTQRLREILHHFD